MSECYAIVKYLLWTGRRGQREGGLRSFESVSWIFFLARALIATCSGHCYPCCLDGNFWPFKACRQVPVSRIPTCHPPLSACNSASFPFSSSRLNLCPASNNPYGVSPVDWVLSAKGCFLLIFILKIKASCWTPGCLGHRTCVSSFASAIYLSYNDWFFICITTYIIFVHLNGPWSKGKGAR